MDPGTLRVQHVKGAREVRAVLNAAVPIVRFRISTVITEEEKRTDNTLPTIIMLATQQAHINLI